MISKQLIKTIGLLTLTGPVLFMIYRILFAVLISYERSITNPAEFAGANHWIWIKSLQVLSLTILIFGITGVYYLLSNVLSTNGFISISVLFLGYILILGNTYNEAFVIPSLNESITINQLSYWSSSVGYALTTIGYVLLGFLLRKHKLFSPTTTISIIVGSIIFAGSRFTNDSAYLIEIVGMVFLFLLGLIPMGLRISKMVNDASK